MYWPKVSEKKRAEMESVKENLRKPLRRIQEEDGEKAYGLNQQPKRRFRNGTADQRNMSTRNDQANTKMFSSENSLRNMKNS